ncbi:ParB/RepB/Spo0J family partition protein, partial [Leptospira idonii]
MKTKIKFDPASLLSKSTQRQSSSNPFLNEKQVSSYQTIDIPIDEIIIKGNPRKTFNDSTIHELAESIKQYGLLQPIVVRKKDGKYELINGERRYRAHLFLKKKFIAANIKNVEQIDITKLPEIKLIENLQREDLTDSDLAISLQELKKRNNETNEGIAKRLNKSTQWVKTKIAHAEILKEAQISAQYKLGDPIFQIPTSLFTELAPLDKENRKKSIEHLISVHEKTGNYPQRANFREFVRPLKTTTVKTIRPKSQSLESLKAELVKVKTKITALQNQKQILEEAIKKAKR